MVRNVFLPKPNVFLLRLMIALKVHSQKPNNLQLAGKKSKAKKNFKMLLCFAKKKKQVRQVKSSEGLWLVLQVAQ